MYTNFFGFSKEPFHTTPDPEFLYLSPSHKQALGSIIYGTSQRKGFIAIVGEVGVGKTTVLRAYLERTPQQKEKTIYIFNSNVSFSELLKTILRSLELQPVSEATSEMVDQLHEALIEEYRSGGTVVLIIDEAQNMPMNTLENLRMLSNLETSTDKLIQIILIGQPELEALLNRQELRQLRQRIAIWAKIDALTEEESREYIECRIAQVTPQTSEIFSGGAIKLLVKAAAGIPRRLNILCDNALVTSFGYQTKPVSSKIVREILSDMDGRKSPAFWKWVPSMAAAAIIVIGFPGLDWLPWPENMRGARVNTFEDQGIARITKNSSDQIPGRQTILPSPGNSRKASSEEPITLGPPQEEMVGPIKTVNLNSQAEANLHTPSVTATDMGHASVGSDVEPVSPNTIQPIKTANLNGQAEANLRAPGVTTTDMGHASVGSDVEPVSPDTIEPIKTANLNGQAEANFRAPGVMATDMGHARVNADVEKVSQNPGVPEPMPPRDSDFPVIKIVQEGETLSQLTKEVYGVVTSQHMEWVKQNNPQILEEDKILSGEKIVFPLKDQGSNMKTLVSDPVRKVPTLVKEGQTVDE